ncbi:MFS transporter [Pedobacter sp. PACM 27299]|uniref:MFS transporter n=1 Tax=Pedobacter sp. PACM 27299 TaxID=1727164 RepID=UPI0007057FFC|nr:MFS transporter [Pedobacter sp. PACM 27299]ALL07560.1 MFS transporter [Pedobacter sp. PACM 27299]
MNNQEVINDAKKATQYIFLVCGFALSSWAPMVPIVKERLQLNDGNLGLLLLFFGAGAISMMPISGYLSKRYGTRIVILFSGIVAAIFLPVLLLMPNPWLMGAALFIFGGGIGVIDVAMNSHGIHVQNRYGRPIMSSLHGLFSVGGLCGALGLGLLMKAGLNPLTAAISIATLLLIILAWKFKSLFSKEQEIEEPAHHTNEEHQTKTAAGWFSTRIIFLGAACFAVFLSEGAMLDWSALFLKENRGIAAELAGVGYATFSIAMAAMRLLGDRIVERFSGKTVVVAGGLIAALGIFIAVSTPWIPTTLLGFVLLGIGAANIVPVFFSEGGKLKGIPASVAIPAISTMGYAGQLAGPALLGFIAYHFSLTIALTFTGVLLLSVALAYAIRKPSV